MMNSAQSRPIYLCDLYILSVTSSVPVAGLVNVFEKVYYHLLSTGETNIPWIAFYFFLIQNLVPFNSDSGLILC